MEQITKTYKVFAFNELSEAGQDKAIEKFSDINVDYDWYEGFEFNQDINTSYKNMYFDLDRGSYIQFNGLTIKDEESFRKILKMNKPIFEHITYRFINDRDNNTEIEIEIDGEDLKETKRVMAQIERAKEIFSDLMHNALSRLKKDYEYLTSRESIIEMIEANEYKFLENGEVF